MNNDIIRLDIFVSKMEYNVIRNALNEYKDNCDSEHRAIIEDIISLYEHQEEKGNEL